MWWVTAPLSLEATNKEHPRCTRAGPHGTQSLRQQAAPSPLFSVVPPPAGKPGFHRGQGGHHHLGSVLGKAVSDLSLLGGDPLPGGEGLVDPQVHW